MSPNLSPYGIAATAAERAKRAQVKPAERRAYVRRCAFRALRGSLPYITAEWAWEIARSAAWADTSAYHCEDLAA